VTFERTEKISAEVKITDRGLLEGLANSEACGDRGLNKKPQAL
jgi:hypothetical protein